MDRIESKESITQLHHFWRIYRYNAGFEFHYLQPNESCILNNHRFLPPRTRNDNLPHSCPNSNRDSHFINSANDNGYRANNRACWYFNSNGDRHTHRILFHSKTDSNDNSKGFHANSNSYTNPKVSTRNRV